MRPRLRYSLLAFFISALLHAGLWGFMVTYEADKKPKPVEKISMQIAMFKQAVIPPQSVEKVEVIEKLKEPLVENKAVSKAKPVSKPAFKPKPKKTIKKKKSKNKPSKKKIAKKKPPLKTMAKKRVQARKPPQKKVVQKLPVQKQPKQVVRHTRPQQNHQAIRARQKQAAAASKAKARAKSAPVTRPAPSRQAVSRPAHNPQREKQYQRSVQQKIERQKNYPRRAKRMRQQGIVKVGFSLSKNGVMSNLRIVQSSGITSLDNATLQAVKKVGRFPVFPAGINKQSISYIIPIAYQLN